VKRFGIRMTLPSADPMRAAHLLGPDWEAFRWYGSAIDRDAALERLDEHALDDPIDAGINPVRLSDRQPGDEQFSGLLILNPVVKDHGYVVTEFLVVVSDLDITVALGILNYRAVGLEQREGAHDREERAPSLREAFPEASYRQPALRSCSQAGLVNNLNDALAWAIVPLFLAAEGASVGQIGLVAGLYPAVWGFGQIWAGHWSDSVGRTSERSTKSPTGRSTGGATVGRPPYPAR
jgi:hypothetical protein